MEILTIGERLGLYRRRAKLTKKALAERAGISVATLTKYENDISVMNDEVLSRLAFELKITSNRLQFGFDDPAKYRERQPLIKQKPGEV